MLSLVRTSYVVKAPGLGVSEKKVVRREKAQIGRTRASLAAKEEEWAISHQED